MMGALIRALTNNAVENIEEALGIGCRNITLSPKSHPKEAAPAPMKRRTIATQTTQTKEITYA